MELRARASRGFTLVELMVVVVIATILLSIAVPSYMSQIRQSRRVEAKTALLDLAGREERFLSTNPAAYATSTAQLGYAGANPVVGSGYYSITVVCTAGVGAALACDPNPVNGPAFFLTATPVAGTSQANDNQCTSFSVDSVGGQFATSAAGFTAQQCWSQ